MTPPRGLTIAGGELRGLRIQTPAGIRPTSGRLREALFSMWNDRLAGCRFLDLFAGSGAVGLEAVSRGASRALLVEAAPRVLARLEANLRRAGIAGPEVLRARLPGELARRLPPEARFDLVFADPPYGFAELGSVLLAVEPYLAAGGEVAVEHRWRDGAPRAGDRLVAVRGRRYGDSGLTLFQRPVRAGG